MKSLMLLFLCAFFACGCSDKPSVFTKKIEKDTGALSIKNANDFLGAVTVGNSLDHELIVEASGGLDLFNINVNLITSDDFSFLGGSFPGNGGTCGNTLKSGEKCKIVVHFGPTKISNQSALFNFTYADSLAARSYRYQLTADSHPILSFEYGSSYDFGNKFAGSSTDLKIKISNTGRVVAQNIVINNMSMPFSFKGGTYPGTGGTCGTQLSPGENCEIIINYSPTTRGQHLQDIVLNYLNNGRTEGNTLHLIAWGFTTSVLSLTSVSDDFGTVANGSAYTKTYTLTHVSGDVAANVIQLSGLTTPFSRVGGNCGATLTVDQHSCTIIIGLNSATSGDWSTPITLSYFNGIQSVTLNKTMTAATRGKPVLSFSVNGTLDLGSVKRNSFTTTTMTVTYASGEIPATALNFSALSGEWSYSGGTCTSQLSSGTCTKIVKFAPTGDYKPPVTLPSLQVSYYDSFTTINAPLIYLKGSSEALLTSSTANFGAKVVGSVTDGNITLNNKSGTSATSISPRVLPSGYSFKGGSFPGIGGTCTSSLLPAVPGTASSSCFMVVQFSPTVEQIYDSTFIIDYNNGVDAGSLTVNLYGSGAPAANLTVENKSFPITGLNSQVPPASMIKITNTGSVTATAVNNITLPQGFIYQGNTNSFPGANGTCTNSLAGNNNFCFINILFNPTIAKAYTETATLTYNNGSGSVATTFTLSGVGENRAELYLSKFNSLNFSQTYVGNSQLLPIQLGHGGGTTYATNITVSSSSPEFSINSNTCGPSMFNAETCSISIKFEPSASGPRSGTLNVNYKVNGVDMTESRALSGTGLAPALLTYNPANGDFSAVGINTTAEKTITVTKSGSPTLNGASVSNSIVGTGFQFKGGTFPGIGGTCPSTNVINYPGTCTIVIAFTPTSFTTFNAQLKQTYSNGYTTYTSILPLSGTGKSKITFDQSTYNFGQVIQSTSAETIITVSNAGPTNYTNLSATPLTAPFSFKGGSYPGTGGTCQSSLASGQNCKLVVVFAPSTTGVQTQSLNFTFDDGYVANAQTSAPLQGEGIAQAIMGVSDGTPYNFGITNVGGSIDKTFLLTNAGTINGTSIAFTFSSVFNFKGGNFPGIGGDCSTTLSAGSFCSIVVSFTPNAAITYTGSMTLNYYDGLRIQTEVKDLRGTGSANLNKDYYLAQIPLKSFSEVELESVIEKQNYGSKVFKRFNADQFKLTAYLNSRLNYLGQHRGLYYRIYNNFDNGYLQGISTVFLKENKFLSGIYKKSDDNDQWTLHGYSLFHQQTGKLLEQWNF